MRENINMKEIHFDIIGKIFGDLEILDIQRFTRINNENRGDWKCIVHCQNCLSQKAISLYTIIHNITTSCGCRKLTGFKEITGDYWSHIQTGAKNRNLEFSITIEYAYELYIKQNKLCALSGVPLIFKKSYKDKTNNISLDRKDSLLGYIVDNVQWVEFKTNISKGNLKDKQFIEYCRLVANKFNNT